MVSAVCTCMRGWSTLTATAAFFCSAALVAACPVMGWLLRCNAAAMLCSRFSVLRSGPAPAKQSGLNIVD